MLVQKAEELQLLVLMNNQFFFFFFFRDAHVANGNSQAGVESELQLPAYAAVTAMQDPSHVCHLYYSSWQHQNLNPLSKASD